VTRLPLPLAFLLVACTPGKSDPPPAVSAEPSIPAIVVDELRAAQRKTSTNEAGMLRSAAQLYLVTNGACPPGIDALAEAKMIPKVPVDPWGGQYAVACTDQGASLTISSPGPDGKAATADDVVVANDEP
jgi:Type II secretion system (T2SS), protein G